MIPLIGMLVKPVLGLIDKFVVDKTKKVEMQAAVKQMELAINAKLVELEMRLVEYKQTIIELRGKIVHAEATGAWYQKMWRPALMWIFIAIIGFNYLIVPIANMFGASLPPLDLPPDMWGLLKIGMGGYIVARSVEKVAPKVAESLAAYKSINGPPAPLATSFDEDEDDDEQDADSKGVKKRKKRRHGPRS